MSCMYFHRPHRDPDDSTESSDSITYWRKLLELTAFVSVQGRGVRSVTAPETSHKYPRRESNLRTRFRKPLLYPLSYGGLAC